jgi:hypothetical protein
MVNSHFDHVEDYGWEWLLRMMVEDNVDILKKTNQ